MGKLFSSLRQHLRRTAVWLCQATVALGAWSCGAGPPAASGRPPLTAQLAAQPAVRVMWVAAHPDDESMAAGLLARACIKHQGPCHFLILTRGGGGGCVLEQGCHPDLATVRQQEMAKAARLYHATLEHYDFFNAPLPVSRFPSRSELARRWQSEGDPAALVARAIRRFRPDLLITLAPEQGFTGHPEHQATARFALLGVKLAADPTATATQAPGLAREAPHRVGQVVHVLNKHWFMALAGNSPDPEQYHEAVDATDECAVDREGYSRSCLYLGKESTRVHRSQAGDMNAARSAAKFWTSTYIRFVDPFGVESDELVAEIAADRAQRAAAAPQEASE